MSEYRSAARLGSWGEAAQEASKQILKKAPWIGAAYAVARKYLPQIVAPTKKTSQTCDLADAFYKALRDSAT
jgi:hypothetical protein